MRRVFSRTWVLPLVSMLACFAIAAPCAANSRHDIETELAKVNHKESWLSEKLAQTEKSIGQISAKYDVHQQQIVSLQAQRKNYESTLQELQIALRKAQKALALSLQNCYRLDIKTGLMSKTRRSRNHDDASEIDRITMYYHYLLSEKQRRIRLVRHLHHNIQKKNQVITTLLKKEETLFSTIKQEKRRLEAQKQAQIAILRSIRQHLPTSANALNRLAKDNKHLRKIVEGSAAAPAIRQDIAATSPNVRLLPFARLRHRLPKPVVSFSGNPRVLHHGVTFFAGEGSDVKAVYPGKVVFSDWLKGYGLLIIIDHGQGYMTLYAHNRSLLKEKNDRVSQGDIIAKVGHTGGIAQNALYFEVRQRGQALPPLQWLG